jgi:hypothetical protein
MHPVLFCALPLAAQNFIQMSDPQFDMFTKDEGFAHETVNFEFAIVASLVLTNIDRLTDAFAISVGRGKRR